MAPDPRIAFFDNLAEKWDSEHPTREKMLAGLVRYEDLLSLQKGTLLLEVGCGTGKTTAWLAERQSRTGRVTAVDFAPRMIEQAKRKEIDADFRCLDICDTGSGGALDRYDVVLCLHSFPHFRDQFAAMRRCAAALTDTGRLIVMHLASSDHINRFHAQLEGPVHGDVLPVGDQWMPLLAAAGLRSRLIDREGLFFLETRLASALD